MGWDGLNLFGFWLNDFAVVDGVVNSQPVFAAGDIRALGVFDDDTPPLIRPAASQWDFLGVAAGEPIYILPSGGVPATLPYLGLSTEDTSLVGFEDDLTFTLASVSGPADSTFNLFVGSTGIFMTGTPTSVSGPGAVLSRGDHQHYNWAFSHLGVYDLTFDLSGTLDGVERTGQATFRFEIAPELFVIPEPSTATLLSLGLGSLLFWRRRRIVPS